MTAHDAGVPALDQGIVVGAARTRAGELGAQLLQQGGDLAVDVLGAVVGVEPLDHKGEKVQEALQNGDREALRDGLDRAHELVLRDLVDQVDPVDALAPVEVALVNGVHPHEAGPSLGTRLALVLDPPRLGVLADQPHQLRPPQPRGLAQEPPHQPLVGLAQSPVLELHQHTPHEGVPGRPARPGEVQSIAAFHEGANLLQALQPLGGHCHDHPPMIPDRPPSGSFLVGIAFPLQAHFSLDKTSP